jgi:hypothetical protein
MRLIQTLLIVTVAGVFVTQAAPDWYSLGLTDRAVHCILADDTSTIIAGTDSGVSVNWNKTWYHIKMLPVTAIVRISSTAVAVVAGNGSKSDGVYIGKSIINGPPFYSFTLGDWIMQPTALAAGPAVSQQAGPSSDLPVVLYAGNKNSVAWGLVSKDSLSKLTTIKMSSTYPFGVEDPFCASLHIFNNRLYAGGYDRSPTAGQSYLLYYFGDSLHAMRQMKTTAITEGRFLSTLGSGFLVMAVADADSGVFFYDQSLGEPWHRIAGPAGTPGSTSAPIRSLYVWQSSPSANDNILYAATKDGVFKGTPNVLLAFWLKVGTLSAEPFFITSVGSSGDLLASTSKGVYRYGEKVTGVLNNGRAAAGRCFIGKKQLSMTVSEKPNTGKIGFDLRGRSMVNTSAGGLLINNDDKSGH